MYIPAGFAPEEEATVLTTLAAIAQKQEQMDKARRLTLYLGIVGATIALAKLGVMTIPFIKARRKRRR